jgi:hypothetical protein
MFMLVMGIMAMPMRMFHRVMLISFYTTPIHLGKIVYIQ